MRLLILHHDRADPGRRDLHYIHAFCVHWEKAGVEIIHRAGCADLPAVDVVLLHVDASVVPEHFTRALRDHPLVWNRRCTDIRKRSLPDRDLLVTSPAEYRGAVIVKTDLNSAAVPELRLFRRTGWFSDPRERWRLFRASRAASSRRDYPVYASSSDVPAEVWRDPLQVVEKFLPEREGDDYVVRWAYFCGSRETAFRSLSRKPVVRWTRGEPEDLIPVPAAISAYRRRIGLDYGKIDYVEHGGRLYVLDVNKTVGGDGDAECDTPLTRFLSEGLLEFGATGPSPR